MAEPERREREVEGVVVVAGGDEGGKFARIFGHCRGNLLLAQR